MGDALLLLRDKTQERSRTEGGRERVRGGDGACFYKWAGTAGGGAQSVTLFRGDGRYNKNHAPLGPGHHTRPGLHQAASVSLSPRPFVPRRPPSVSSSSSSPSFLFSFFFVHPPAPALHGVGRFSHIHLPCEPPRHPLMGMAGAMQLRDVVAVAVRGRCDADGKYRREEKQKARHGLHPPATLSRWTSRSAYQGINLGT